MSNGDPEKRQEEEVAGQGRRRAVEGVEEGHETLNASTEFGAYESGTRLLSSAQEPPIPAELVNHPRYRVEKFLGHGGMGMVWLARHLVMDRWVALKAIRSDLLTDADAHSRFRREVQAQGRLHHPNIATAFDAEQIGNTTFLVVEYVPGMTLQEAVAKKSLSLNEICRAIRDTALGLHHAHEHGLIHRDVKPSNLIRTKDGNVKILDFGLVSIADMPTDETLKGLLIGTPDYISPEQAENPKKADKRSDIYSLGCTFYCLLSGRPPFLGSSFLSKLDAHRHETPAPVQAIPEPLQKILFKMMAKRPESRFATAKEVAEELAPYCATSNFGLSKPIEVRRRVVWMVASSIALCVLLSSLYLYLAASPTPRWKGPLSLTRPSRISDGNDADVHVVGDSVTLDGTKNQVWVDYQDGESREFWVKCLIRYLQKSPGNYCKFGFQT